MNELHKNYFIAETAFHHEGDVDFLKQLIHDISQLNIDAIKVHLLFDVDDYMVSTHSAREVIVKISIPQVEWSNIFELIESEGKEIVALVNDVRALKFVNEVQFDYPISAIELHSTGLNDVFLLEESVRFEKTIILGVGGSTFDEIQFAVDYLRNHNKQDILLMHGFQNYPTKYEDINFERIPLLKKAFDLPIGYADHTDPLDDLNSIMSVGPLNLGVRVFEKHVTNVFGEKRIDAQAAITTQQMADVIRIGNEMLKTLGTGMKYSVAELNYGNTGPMKKALVARRSIKKGQVLQLEDIAYKRTESSAVLQQKDIMKIVGLEALSDIETDEMLSFENLKYQFKPSNFDQFFIKK